MSSIAQFRSDFPEFSDTKATPDSLITLWMSVSTSLINADRWAELTDIGIELATAHHLVLATRDIAASSASGAPTGAITAPMSSTSVGGVSASYDTSAIKITDAGFWAMTSYGIRFLSLSRMMGAGGMQLGAYGFGAPGEVGAWGAGGLPGVVS